MDKKSKILLSVMALLIVGAVVATYYNIFIQKNYKITMEVSCDPESESGCFLRKDEETGKISYYKILDKTANQFSTCSTEDENCQEPRCTEGEESCSYTYCDPNNLEEGGVCAELASHAEIPGVEVTE